MKCYIYSCILICLISFASCKKDKKDNGSPVSKGVYITNEGIFNAGQAEVSFYDPIKQEVSNNLFYNINGYHLGDVAQSMYIKDSVGFIVVNNSAKVEVVQIPSLRKIRTINIPGSSPRYFLPINDSIAYVSDLYAKKIHVVNYNTGQLVKEIDQPNSWTEHMLVLNGDVIVEERNLDTDHATTVRLVRINTASHSIAQQYSFNGLNINGIAKDKDGHLWMAVEQDTTHNITSSLYCLNADLGVNKKLDFTVGHHPDNLSINSTGDVLYFTDGDLFSVPVSATSVPANAFVTRDNRNFYGLGIDPLTNDIYVSDALDYVQPSKVYRYNKNGQLIHSFNGGIIAGNFAFSYE